MLESRQLLSITLGSLAAQTVSAGAPLNVALHGTNTTGNEIIYSVSLSNSSLVSSSGTSASLSATVNNSNPSLALKIDDNGDKLHGTLTLELFEDLAPETVDQIMTLVNSGYYDGLTFHRIIENFMIQGGDPLGNGTGGPGYSFNDEFTDDLQFTSSGLLAMANSGSDTNGSQFFITTKVYRDGDFKYTIFGMLTDGSTLLGQLDSVATNSSDAPKNSVVISDASIIYDANNGVLRLSAPDGTTGTVDVTVTATDSVTGEFVTKTFRATVAADATNDRPFVEPVAPIVINPGATATLTIPATDVEGDAIYYDASISSGSDQLTLSVDHTTGVVTITADSDATAGAYSVLLKAKTSSSATDFDTQNVIVNVSPTNASVSGYVYVDSDNNGDRMATGQTPHLSISGVVLKLYRKDSSEVWTEVAKTVTGEDGSYQFSGLAAGTYRVKEIQPDNYLGGKETAGSLTSVTTNTNAIDNIVLAASGSLTEYNFGERGLKLTPLSVKQLLAVLTMSGNGMTNTAPVVVPSGNSAAAEYSTTYTGTPVAIVDSEAKITDADGSTLTSVTATIANRQDGDSEVLNAVVTGTSISASYADGVLTLSGVGSLSRYQQILSTVTYSNTAASPHAGDRTILIVANDGVANSEAASVTVAVGNEPLNYAITPGDSIINAAEKTSTSFSLSNAEVGAAYAYKITTSGGAMSVSGSGTITSATQQVTGIDLSSLADGTLTYSITLTDTDGNVGAPATATARLDQNAPSGYSITANNATLTSTTAASTGFTFASAEVGATYAYTVSSSGGSTTVTGSGTVTSATQVVSGLNVSGLAAGTLTFSVKLTDKAGNEGGIVSATATLS